MIRIILAILLLAFHSVAHAAADPKSLLADVPLQHKWEVKCDANACAYKSTYKPPAPFASESEAVMAAEFVPLKEKNLDKVLKSEVAAIRGSLKVEGKSLEEDGRSETKGIAVWKEKFDGKEVGFIRYRAYDESAPAPHFFTTIHGIVLGTHQECLVHLITFYAGHQDETRADQIAIIKALVKSVNGK